jgi:hypothetical protein
MPSSQESRIQPEEVTAAYKATGLREIREVYCDRVSGVLCGCPLTALYLVAHPKARRSPAYLCKAVDTWAGKKYGSWYTRTFTAAFDSGVGNLDRYAEQRAIDGFDDGRAVARAVWMEFAEVVNG